MMHVNTAESGIDLRPGYPKPGFAADSRVPRNYHLRVQNDTKRPALPFEPSDRASRPKLGLGYTFISISIF
jgi:hypothetical protein